jgi:hypothetical protein
VTASTDVPDELWRDSFTFFAQMVSPWVALTDPARFVATVDEIARLDLAVVTGGHMAPLHGEQLQRAMTMLRALPTVPMAPLPGQADLDALLLAGTRGAEAADEMAGLVTVGA